MNKERREYPRINKSLKIGLKAHSFDLYTVTKNISCSGTYCSVKKFIPSMSKLDILLFLPEEKNEKRAKHLHLKGVVVRSKPNIVNDKLTSADIAIFFSDISEATKKAISDYVTYHLKTLL